MKNKHVILKKKYLLFSIVPVLGIFAFVFIFIQTHQNFAANFADNVMRPLLGNQTTVTIESIFFGIDDEVNQVKYSFVKPSVTASTLTPIPTMSNKKTENMELSSIPAAANFPPLTNEGTWSSVKSDVTETLIAKTIVRPDPQRSYAVVNLVKMNMNKLNIDAVAGKKEPGGIKNPGTGFIPKAIQTDGSLLAAFNGGFQQKDGYYGMIADGKTYLPLLPNLATLVIHKNSTPQIIKYTNQKLSNDVISVRQNGLMLIEDSQLVASSSAWNMQTWGLTVTNTMYTWRSGIGVSKDGNLIYAAGPSLVPETLARALQMAGAVNGMQLDINPVWVRFIVYTDIGNGRYKYASLEKKMVNGGYEYLNGYQKDFFYVYKKTI